MNFLIFIILILTAVVYLKVATKFKIVDNPNERSSHKNVTIRGGGIVFFIAVLLFFIFYDFKYPYFFIGLTLVAVISFVDDIMTLKSSIRFLVQLFAVILMLFELEVWNYPIIYIILSLFFATGLLNIYNFMDGINGITGLNGIVIFLSLIYVNVFQIRFIDTNLLIAILSSLVVFGFFNFRKKAKFFAGDIGSISLGLTIIFCIGKLYLTSNQPLYLLFTLAYITDGGLTILQRILKKKNIFKPHREHLYQLMVDTQVASHMNVAMMYAFFQLVVCVLVIISDGLVFKNLVFYVIMLGTFIAYMLFKRKLLKLINQNTLKR
tara:strand:- start:1785 stop:2750 length:966 start_codon:yes stop_codon:yes gene_type:complete